MATRIVSLPMTFGSPYDYLKVGIRRGTSARTSLPGLFPDVDRFRADNAGGRVER